MEPISKRTIVRPRAGPERSRRPAMCETLENRLLCRIAFNGDFVIRPPGGGQGHSTIHQHPQQGVIGLRTADARSNGVVNWQVTSIEEITPGRGKGRASA